MRPKKHLGQNFLINKNIVKTIVDSVDLKSKTVFEIGPGRGALTSLLAENAQFVYAFEIDKSLKTHLNEIEKSNDNIKVIYDDVLKINFNEFIKDNNLNDVYLIANIPYYITGPLLNKVIKTVDISVAVIMMQKEVGERLLASPTSKAYGNLTVMFNFHFDITRVVNVKRTNFYPRPKVDSVVLKFERKNDYLKKVDSEEFFTEFVDAAFKMKRKTLVNNLKAHFDLSTQEVIDKLQKTDVNFNDFERAENITVMRFIELANGWNK